MRNDLEEYVEFSRRRDLARIIGDTFTFLRYEWQPFISTILKFSIIPILITLTMSVYFTFYAMGYILNMGGDDPLAIFGLYTSRPFLLLGASQVFTFSFMMVSAFAYIKSYAENKGKIDLSEIRATINSKIAPFVGLYVLNSIVVIAGFMFLIIPGIYLAVVLTFPGCLLVFDDKPFSEAFSDSFSFLKEYWWEAFGVLFLIHLIVGVITLVINHLIELHKYTGYANMYGSEYSILDAIFSDTFYLGLVIFVAIISIVFKVITTVSTAFIYFDISEKIHPNRYRDEIDTLGRE